MNSFRSLLYGAVLSCRDRGSKSGRDKAIPAKDRH